ncbi:hypothetical protein [Microbacterium sp. H1-D42]|uniref:hypothetical protein n=1 Tax=Microbacterium sp. H1-D42 TaxID=2925844 RepID=UPI001F5342A6|nr:hypothetical protein [Microbacterium sp. H1-D42]UNK70913.1 hypothetical protein MNR00_00270 [Microbacterium sp. H1-D42]
MEPPIINTSALTGPVDPRAAASEANRASAGGCVVVGLIALLPAFVALIISVGSGGFLTTASLIAWGVVVAIIVIGWLWLRRRNAENGTRLARLRAFAAANGFTYTGRITAPQEPGVIFGMGTNPTSADVIAATEPRAMRIGEHRYVAGYRDSESYVWGFATVPLEARLPWSRLVLQPRSTAKRLPVRTEVAPGQLEITGRGGEHFEVWGPVGQAAAVQAFLDSSMFAPAVLDRLIEQGVYVEIGQDALYLYSWQRFATDQPAFWESMPALLLDTAEAIEEALPLG